MDLLTGLNRAMDYIEDNICEEIVLEAVAAVTPYSAFHFQRLFGYLTDQSLSEYIRRRKMTLAAIELQHSDIKVLDLAVKYGYDSADSFCRAFAKLHGVPPSQARLKGTELKSWPKLNFQILVKGEKPMDYRIEEWESFDVVGLHRHFSVDADRMPHGIPDFWTELRNNGKLEGILRHSDGRFEEAVGICTNGTAEGFDYFIAIPTKRAQAPEGLELLTIPKSTFAVFHLVGPLDETMSKAEKMIFTEWMPSSGYAPVLTPEMEVYSKKPHGALDYECWVYVPVKKK